MNNSPIGIFDSGVGGLTILGEIQKLLPQESYIYLADQTYAPYGTKNQKQLEKRVVKIVRFLESKNVKLIVIACNTATVQTLDFLRKLTGTPIIGVVPVIKTAVAQTSTKNVVVFTTPATANSAYLKNLIQAHAPDVKVEVVGETGLENLIEEGKLDSPKISTILKFYLKPLVKHGVDVVALGCTHYPFIKIQIEAIVGNSVKVLDSGGAVARQAKKILEANQTLADKRVHDWYYTTGDPKRFGSTTHKLLDKHLANIVRINI